jgi:hypothetical protein
MTAEPEESLPQVRDSDKPAALRPALRARSHYSTLWLRYLLLTNRRAGEAKKDRHS